MGRMVRRAFGGLALIVICVTSVARADERYIRDSILLPNKEVAAGYPPVMPSFAGQLGEDEIMKLIAYIQSLSPASANQERAR